MAVLVAGMLLLASANPFARVDVDTDEVATVAEEAGVNSSELYEALQTVGEVNPRRYLIRAGELQDQSVLEPNSRPAPQTSAPALATQAPGVPYGVWDRLAACESGDGTLGSANWHIDAYHDGGLQFLPSTWTAYGGGQYARYAWQATREQQIAIAQKVQRAAGWGQWPVCSRRLGLR